MATTITKKKERFAKTEQHSFALKQSIGQANNNRLVSTTAGSPCWLFYVPSLDVRMVMPSINNNELFGGLVVSQTSVL